MSYKLNDTVFIVPLKKSGIIVECADRRGKYRVAVGNLTIECRESELTATEGSLSSTNRPPVIRRKAARESDTPFEVDLHGLSVSQMLSLVENEISKAVLAERGEIRFVHGLGTGILRQELHKLLKNISAVSNFRLDGTNPGVTRVFL